MADETVVTTVKPWWQSKTIIVNGLVVLAAALMALIDAQTAGTLPFVLDAKWTAFVLGVVNFGLRFLTNQPVTGGAKPEALPRYFRE